MSLISLKSMDILSHATSSKVSRNKTRTMSPTDKKHKEFHNFVGLQNYEIPNAEIIIKT